MQAVDTNTPLTQLRPSDSRGHVDMGWLKSQHTFSFGSYHDPRHMGHGPLRVINDDRVIPGAGFPTHGHTDMEILSYVVDGALAHRDSTGGGGVLRPGQVQLMSAGRGIRHSEFNGSESEGLRFLQVWVIPAKRGTAPSYIDHDFGQAPGVVLLASPDARAGSLRIGQDVDIYRVLLSGDEQATIDFRGSRGWIQVVRGHADVAQHQLREGDGLALTNHPSLKLRTDDTLEALVFDLP